MKKKILRNTNILILLMLVLAFSGCGKNATGTVKAPEKEKEVAVETAKTQVVEEEKKQQDKGDEKPVEKKIDKPKVAKVIVIDPGHASRSNLEKEPLAPGSKEMKIKDGGGAAGVATKTPEHLINMNVSMKLKESLQQKGYQVVMTKTDNSVSLGNVERAEVGNKANAALVIRIHADSAENSSASGASMLVPEAMNENTKAIQGESQRCGKIILDELASEVGMKNRGVVRRSDMTGFNWSKVPVVLVEAGFLSNPQEDRSLSSNEYQDKIANALAEGISKAIPLN